MADLPDIKDIGQREIGIFAGGLALGAFLLWLVLPSTSAPPIIDEPPVETPVIEAPTPEAPGALSLSSVKWPALEGWAEDDLAIALKTFNTSCAALLRMPADKPMDGGAFAGTAGDWQAVCELALIVAPETEAARVFFEHAFTPFSVQQDGKAKGLFTGYYVPVLQGRSTPNADFDVPLLARPDDLVSVDLGNFVTDLAGQKIYGRVVDGRLAPYFSRADIETGTWSQTPQPLVWLQDPVEAFFLHIQGSGMVRLEDGSSVRMGFAGKNGHPYTSVGRYLIRENLLGKHEASMQGIKAWVAANPDDRQSVLHQNASYVFFQKQQANGAIGALNVALTAERSLAVDRRHIPLGAPLWLAIDPPANQDVSGRLMIAQDTGGAIKGAVRGDFYWGEGDEAGARAGRMKQQGRYFILLPNDLAAKVARP
jgi:membrane-bound lytic murein transglycosylase A